MSNLALRIATACVLIPAMIALVMLAPDWLFAGCIAAVVLAASWEWAAFGTERRALRAGYVGATAVVLVLAYFLSGRGLNAPWAMVAALAWWGLALYWIVQVQLRDLEISSLSHFERCTPAPLVPIYGWLAMVPAWLSLLWLREHGSAGAEGVVGLFVIIWSADIGAYFAGRQFGRTRLASRVSPGKTWEGVAGGVLLAVVAAFLIGWVLHDSHLKWAVLGLLTVAFSVVGDLLESLFKRHAGVKDSGGLLPGHGGILDRVDSLLSGAPVFGAVLWFWGG